MLLMVLLMAMQGAVMDQPSIEQVQNSPQSFVGKQLKLCGEVTSDKSTLYSDTRQRIHGRVGLRLQGATADGRGRCMIGRLTRADGRMPKAGYPTLVTDAAVPPEYVFVVDQIAPS